jgi:REP element-mobilizing transposase RayT
MLRSARIAPGGVIFHCLNRGNDRRELFADDAGYAAFERVLESAPEAVPVRLLAYCLMPNHWHLLLWRAERRRAGAVHAAVDDDRRPTMALTGTARVGGIGRGAWLF